MFLEIGISYVSKGLIKLLEIDQLEKFYLNSTLNFVIPPVLVFQLEVYYRVDRLLTGLTAQQKGITARWYSNKTSLYQTFHGLISNTQSIIHRQS